MASSPPANLLNSLVVEFDSIYALGDKSVSQVFKLIGSSGLCNFLGGLLLEIYPDELLSIYGSSSIDEKGKFLMKINDFSLSVDEAFFVDVFQLCNEGLTSLSSISSENMDEILKICAISPSSMKLSSTRKEMKVEYQLLTDVVAKPILTKAWYFTAMTVENFQVMTAIIKRMKVNWSSVLFTSLKNMVQNTKKSFGFAIQLSKIVEDSGIPLNGSTSLHKSRMLNAQRVITLKPKIQSLNIAPAELLAVKKEIGEDMGNIKKSAKESKSKAIPAPKPKPKGKMITHDSDYEGTPSQSHIGNK